MKSIDLLMTHIKHCPYPLWMERTKFNMDCFTNQFIYFSEHNRFPYFDHYVHEELHDIDNLHFIDPVETDWTREDWRNKATNEMLKYSTSEWVGSIEQDWFYTDWNKLWDAVQKASETADCIGWWQPGNYIHPAFWFIRREVLEKTRKDFSAHDGYDHFGWISRDLLDLGYKITSLQDLGFRCDVDIQSDCFHLGGVNQNFLDGLNTGFQFHRGELFYIYNYYSLQVKTIKQHPLFVEKTLKIQERLKAMFPNTDPVTSEWRKFFI